MTNALAFTFPEPTTPLEIAAAGARLHPATLRELVAVAGWNQGRQASEFGTGDWLERLKLEITTREVARRVQPIGPEAARELSVKDCYAKISAPPLRKAGTTYTSGAALLLGKTGIGKTLTALVMARKFAAAREQARLLNGSAENLAEECTHARPPGRLAVAWLACSALPRLVSSQPFGREPEELARAKRAPLAVLDDVTWGDNDKALLELIAHRYDHGLPSIATAGATRAELVTRFGDAVVRRLLECRGVKGLLVEAF